MSARCLLQKLSLPKEIRAHLGYLLGARLMVLGKKEDAKKVLGGAIEDAQDERVRAFSKAMMDALE